MNFDESLKFVTKERRLYHNLKKFLTVNLQSIGLLFGIRQVGKTILLKQLARDMPNSVYVNFKEKEFTFNEIAEILGQSADFYFFDEFTHMSGYDLILSSIFMSLERHNKTCKIIITGSSYSSLKQIAVDELGGGRSAKFELFPIDFEEYLYFTAKISSYGDNEYMPTTSDIYDYLKLTGMPEGLKIVLDRDYFGTWYDDMLAVKENKFNRDRALYLEEHQVTHMVDLLAYTLNKSNTHKALRTSPVGVREFGLQAFDFSNSLVQLARDAVFSLTPKDIGAMLAWGLSNGFLFLDLACFNGERQDTYKAYYEVASISDIGQLKSILSEYNVSPISPLIYSRLKIDLESIADQMASAELIGDLYELAIKAEDVRAQGFRSWHRSYKLRQYGTEIDLYTWGNNSENEPIGLLLEATLRRKSKEDTSIHSIKDVGKCVRVLTDIEGTYCKDNNFYRIGYPLALYMLSNGSLFNLDQE